MVPPINHHTNHTNHPDHTMILESYSGRFVFSLALTVIILALHSVLQWLQRRLYPDDDDHIDTESEDYKNFIAAEMLRLHGRSHCEHEHSSRPIKQEPIRSIKQEPVPEFHHHHWPQTPPPTSHRPRRRHRRRHRVKQEEEEGGEDSPSTIATTVIPQPGDFVFRRRPAHLVLRGTPDELDLWDGPFAVLSTTLQHWVELRVPAGSKTPAWTPITETLLAAPPPPSSLQESGDGEGGYVVDCVRALRVRGRVRMALVHWKGWGVEDDTWEPENALPGMFVEAWERRVRRWEKMGGC